MNERFQIVDRQQATPPRLVTPFYAYSAVAFLAACVLLVFSRTSFLSHHFNPSILAITHVMALGWGTMMIIGASHQLLPVLVQGKLHSPKLANAAFVLTGLGIPVLAYSFFQFEMGDAAKWGGRLVVLGLLAYLINVTKTVRKSEKAGVQGSFLITAVIWLFLTAFYGLSLVYNFTFDLFPKDSVHYLPVHAHTGIVGWFLLTIIGVSSRLLPMFTISHYENNRLLWIIYSLINGSLIGYVGLFHLVSAQHLMLLPLSLLLIGIGCYMFFCYKVYTHRMRKRVDSPMKLSLTAVLLIGIFVLILTGIAVTALSSSAELKSFVMLYGFLIFFGWITAIILGMTFKTLPFIVWNQHKNSAGILPKHLVNQSWFKIMAIAYGIGILSFVIGLIQNIEWPLLVGSIALLIAAIFYGANMAHVLLYSKKTS